MAWDTAPCLKCQIPTGHKSGICESCRKALNIKKTANRSSSYANTRGRKKSPPPVSH